MGLFEIEPSEEFLLEFQDHELAENVTKDLRCKIAEPDSLEHRNRVLENITTWRRNSLARGVEELESAYMSEQSPVNHLSQCRTCATRLERHCLNFSGVWIKNKKGAGLSSIHEWIGSCGGCGMCDHQCPQGYPLFDVIIQLSHRYRADSSLQTPPLPP